MADLVKLLAAAKAGKLDKIFDLAGFDEEGGDDDASTTALYYFLVAADFGHDVEDEIDSLMTGSDLHFDDGQMAEALTELELAEDYLRGESGLKVDLKLARAHLERAAELEVDKTTDVAKSFPALRKKLKPDALAVFDAVFKPAKTKKPAAKKKKR